jgi:hypothetical protein
VDIVELYKEKGMVPALLEQKEAGRDKVCDEKCPTCSITTWHGRPWTLESVRKKWAGLRKKGASVLIIKDAYLGPDLGNMVDLADEVMKACGASTVRRKRVREKALAYTQRKGKDGTPLSHLHEVGVRVSDWLCFTLLHPVVHFFCPVSCAHVEYGPRGRSVTSARYKAATYYRQPIIMNQARQDCVRAFVDQTAVLCPSSAGYTHSGPHRDTQAIWAEDESTCWPAYVPGTRIYVDAGGIVFGGGGKLLLTAPATKSASIAKRMAAVLANKALTKEQEAFRICLEHGDPQPMYRGLFSSPQLTIGELNSIGFICSHVMERGTFYLFPHNVWHCVVNLSDGSISAAWDCLYNLS